MQHLLFWIVFIFIFATVNTWKDPNVFFNKRNRHACIEEE